MIEILNNIKNMIISEEKEKAVKYIDKIISENKDAGTYIDDLIKDLK